MKINFVIAQDDLSDGKIIELLQAHLNEMQQYSPPESIHALDKAAMHSADITFWGARYQNQLIGCGALKQLSPKAGEIKSMKTNPNFLRCGVGASILQHILAEATKRTYQSVSLETGTHAAFDPAVSLYLKNGFVESNPFGSYQREPFSRFYTKQL
ncbi:GNAT family N-acetyltransferase [Aliikangiella maris]|uniref:GNAT family N-acetyltransferase n=2 Tax=Aliikangiella maris TaxID=3162458 RepID=A0ABV3MTQ4_9GAMM